MRSNKLFLISLTALSFSFAGNTLAKDADYEAFTVAEKDVADIYVNADGSSVETYELQTLVRSQLVVDNESQADISYLSDFDTVKLIDAYTITSDGLKVPVEKNAIRIVDGDKSDGKSMYSDIKHLVIVFPRVSPGVRTYYKVQVTRHTPLFPNNYFVRYWFGADTQWAHSEVNLSNDPKIKLYVDTKCVDGGRVEDGPGGEVRYRLSYRSKQVHIPEPGQISAADVSPYIHISSFKDQLDMADAYEARAADKYKVTPKVQRLADEITRGSDGKLNQAKALYHWVSKEIRYVAIYYGAGGVVPHYADEIIDNQYGDCKDKTTLLIALLNAKGIKASAAEINLGTAYSMPKIAVLGPFNHVITYLPQWNIYLDPTAERAPFGVLPYSEIDKPTILTGLHEIGRTPKPDAKQNVVSTIVKMSVGSDGRITGSSHTDYFGAEDIKARYAYEGSDSAYGEQLAKNELYGSRLSGTGSYKPTRVMDLEKPFELDTEFELDPMANVPGPGAIAIPMGLAPGEFGLISFSKSIANPTEPVVCRSRALMEVAQINFPLNVSVTHIPEGVSYKSGDIDYKSTYIKRGNFVEARREVVIQHPTMICDVNEVKEWNKFVAVVQKDLRSQVFYR